MVLPERMEVMEPRDSPVFKGYHLSLEAFLSPETALPEPLATTAQVEVVAVAGGHLEGFSGSLHHRSPSSRCLTRFRPIPMAPVQVEVAEVKAGKEALAVPEGKVQAVRSQCSLGTMATME